MIYTQYTSSYDFVCSYLRAVQVVVLMYFLIYRFFIILCFLHLIHVIVTIYLKNWWEIKLCFSRFLFVWRYSSSCQMSATGVSGFSYFSNGLIIIFFIYSQVFCRYLSHIQKPAQKQWKEDCNNETHVFSIKIVFILPIECRKDLVHLVISLPVTFIFFCVYTNFFYSLIYKKNCFYQYYWLSESTSSVS